MDIIWETSILENYVGPSCGPTAIRILLLFPWLQPPNWLPTLIRTKARCLASSARTGRASKLVEFPSWGPERLASCGWVTFPCILPSLLLDSPPPPQPILRAAVPFISKSPFLTTHLSSTMFHPIQWFSHRGHFHPWSLQGHETFVSVKSQQRQNIPFQKPTIH